MGQEMSGLWQKMGIGGALVAALALTLSPAISAPGKSSKVKKLRIGSRSSLGTFTPASADPRLAAIFARSNVRTSNFKFTPANTNSKRPSRALTVAVRTQTAAPKNSLDRPRPMRAVRSADAGPTVAPVAYNLGVAVGWKRFALTGEVAQAELGTLQGGRRVADVGVSYSRKKLTTRVQVEASQPIGRTSANINEDQSVAVDFGGSFRLTRKIDLTAGVRYKSERDRLKPEEDTRRDSQAVYVGTAFKF